jgi:hypothetical protein
MDDHGERVLFESALKLLCSFLWPPTRQQVEKTVKISHIGRNWGASNR